MSHYRGRTVLKSTIPDGERLRWASMKCRSSANSPSAGGACLCASAWSQNKWWGTSPALLFQVCRKTAEGGGEMGAHRRHAGNDDHGNQRGDQAIFDGGRAIFGFQKFQNQRHGKSSPKRLHGAKAHASRLLISGFRFSSTLSGAGARKEKTAKNRAVSQNPLCNFGYRDSKRTNKALIFQSRPVFRVADVRFGSGGSIGTPTRMTHPKRYRNEPAHNRDRRLKCSN